MPAQSVPVSPAQEVLDEFITIIIAFGAERPENLLALSQFLRRRVTEVERRMGSERALEAHGQATLLTLEGCNPEE